jgi:hypothetical protein
MSFLGRGVFGGLGSSLLWVATACGCGPPPCEDDWGRTSDGICVPLKHFGEDDADGGAAPDTETDEGSIGDRVVLIPDVFVEIPLTVSDAESAGWTTDGSCEDQMGIHGMQEGGGVQYPMEVLYNDAEAIAGIEFVSEGPQTTPPWEEMDGMYSIHVYFQDPADICSGKNAPFSDSIGDTLIVTFDVFNALPLTYQEAESEGWISDEECVVGHGMHAILAEDGGLYPIEMLYDSDGSLVGIELSSAVEMSTTIWEAEKGGPDTMWNLHAWFRDPTDICR